MGLVQLDGVKLPGLTLQETLLPGFTIIEEIYRTSQSVLFRALRERDTSQVVLKTVPSRLASPESTAHLRREYTVARDLQDSPFIAKPLELIQHGDTAALVLEDFGATSLQAYVRGGRLGLHDVLRVGIAVASALDHVHGGGLLHLDVKPANVLVSANLAVIKLTDFSISSLLPEHSQAPVSPEALRGTAAYISPEQTGRMNRTIDSRSDLYALGVTLYELAVGARPFHSEDLQHLLYQHLAVVPTPPTRRDPAFPPVVSDIIMKLLHKDAANRYQTAAGLRNDLQACLDQLVQHNCITAFPLGRADQRGQLRVPDHVLGREHELQLIGHCHKRVAERQSMEVILISGYSGVGKTALVGELQRAHTTGKEGFVQGKFDQYSHDTPFKPLIAAMQSLLRQVLCEPAGTIGVWQERVQAALGRNGRLMTDVLPGLGHLIGPQPELPPVDATAAQNRFSDTFVRLIRTCAQLRSPLVIFLDDLQWSDGPSLRLLEALVKDGRDLPLLLIGAYRDVEVDDSHALTRLVTGLQGSEVPLLQLHLGPLKLPDTTALVAACLGLPAHDAGQGQRCAELGALVQEKTEGNPFYCLQFLRALVKDGLLHFDKHTGECRWGDLSLLRERAHVTMNVVDFMANELRTRLPAATLEVLSVAACIGDVFTLHELTLVCDKLSGDLVGQLWPALTAGFIFLVGKEWQAAMGKDAATLSSVRFRFRHDRIRQAAYQEVLPTARAQLHLRVGRQLMAGLPREQYKEQQYGILHHFNEAIHLITDPAERLKLVTANMAAGVKAKASTAYEVAVRHASCAKRLLGGSAGWGSHPDLMLLINMDEAECLSLIGKHEEALALLEELRKRVNNDASNSLRIAEMRVNALTLAGQLVASMDAALEAVALLATPLPTEDAALEAALAEEQPRVEAHLAAADLASLPQATDPESLALLRLMDCVIVGGYSTGQVKLIHLLTLRMVSVALSAGISSPGCIALLLYAAFFDARLKRYEAAYTLGKLAVAAMDRLPDQSKRGQLILTFASAVAHWVRPLQEIILLFEEGLAAALDVGDHVYAAYHLSQAALYHFYCGAPLLDVQDKAESCQRALHRIGDTSQRAITTAVHHATRVLMKDVPAWDRCKKDDDTPWEAAYLCEHASNVLALAFYYTLKVGTLCCLGDYREADAALAAMGSLRTVLQPTVFSVIVSFYEAVFCSQLLHAAAADSSPTKPWEDRLNQCVTTLQEYAAINPGHQHRYCLARAEQERWKGDKAAAEHHYALAIDAAEEGRFVQDAALAYLLASRHWAAVGRARLAAWHHTEAYDAFAAWGATAVLHRLALAPSTLRPGRRRLSDGSALTSSHSAEAAVAGTTLDTLRLSSFSEQSLDIRAVLAASQTLSSAIVREALLEKLLGIVLETAGARYVALVLRRPGDDGGWYMEGSASVQVRAGPRSTDPPSPRLNGLSLNDDVKSPSPGVDTVTQVAPAGQVVPLSEAGALVPQALITYVTRTQEVVLGGVELGGSYKDAYLEAKRPRSVLCMPIVRHGDSYGVLYVEHELLPDAFPASRIKILAMLSSQIAISIENSALYEQMQSRQNELIAAKNAAEEATHAKSLFLATMSHEIRTPLNAIIGMTSLLMGFQLSDEKRECVETIRQSGDQLLAVISDVLDFSKIEAGTLELEAAPFSVRQCLEEAADLVAARAADKGLHLATHTAATIPAAVTGDVSRLRQVLVNLLSNAVKFTDEGEVILQAAVVAVQGKQVQVEFTCRDSGIGIAPEHIPRLFAAFSQADASTTRKFGGTGLGLAISDRLVKAMGGQFQVESALGAGTTFRFAIPLEAASGAGEAGEGARRELAGRACLMLVHSGSLAAILKEQLAAWGLRCTHARMVTAAQQLIKQQGATSFDIVIADKCPTFDKATVGLTECPIAKVAPQLPAVVLCSWTDWNTKASLGPLRAVVSKPVKMGHLWDALTKLLRVPRGAAPSAVPPISASADEGPPSPMVASAAMRSALRILLTEDNPVNQRVAQMLLKRLGYRADCVADGIECIRSLERRPYDVVLMDLSMPVMDGLQAARVICSRWAPGKRPYLVAVTANAMEGDRDRCLAAGMDDYISKPVRINDLQKVLDEQALKTNERLDSPQSVLQLPAD